MADKEATSGQSSSSSGNQQQPPAGDGAQNGASQGTPQRPENLPDAFWDDKKGGLQVEPLLGSFRELTAFKAEADLKRASIPQNPDLYKLDLPNGFQLPAEFKDYKINDKDPRLPAARKFAHEAGLDQAGFSRLLGIQAQADLVEAATITTRRKEEIAKLGDNGTARVDAVRTWLKARIGEDRGVQMLDRLILSTDLEAMEDIIKLFSSQGTQPFNQRNRESGRTDELSDEEYEKMSPSEKLAYARKHKVAAAA